MVLSATWRSRISMNPHQTSSYNFSSKVTSVDTVDIPVFVCTGSHEGLRNDFGYVEITQ